MVLAACYECVCFKNTGSVQNGNYAEGRTYIHYGAGPQFGPSTLICVVLISFTTGSSTQVWKLTESYVKITIFGRRSQYSCALIALGKCSHYSVCLFQWVRALVYTQKIQTAFAKLDLSTLCMSRHCAELATGTTARMPSSRDLAERCGLGSVRFAKINNFLLDASYRTVE